MPDPHERDLRELLRSAFPDDAAPERLVQATRSRIRRREARRRAMTGAAAAVVVLALLATPAVVDILTRQDLRFDPPLDEPGSASPTAASSPSPTPTPSSSPAESLPPSPDGPDAAAPGPAPARSDPASSQTATLDVYFSRGQPGEDGCATVTPVDRRVQGPGYAAGALAELFQGPEEQERAMGYQSPFGPATAGLPFTVAVKDGIAHVDFGSLEGIELPEDDCRAQAVLDPLDATLLQFPTVDGTRYTLRGSVEDFSTALGIPADSATEVGE